MDFSELQYTHMLLNRYVLLRVYSNHVDAIEPNGKHRRASTAEINEMREQRARMQG